MVLGYHNHVPGDLEKIEGVIDDFFDHATGLLHTTIVDSFLHANTDWTTDLPAAIVEHVDNDGDYLKEVTRDTASNDMRYYWYDIDNNEWNIGYPQSL